MFLFCLSLARSCSGCPLEGYPATQLRAVLAHSLLQRLQRYQRRTQRAAQCHNHTNAGNAAGRQWPAQNRSISPPAAAANLHGSWRSASWDVSGGLDQCWLSQRSSRSQQEIAALHVRRTAAGIAARAAVADLERVNSSLKYEFCKALASRSADSSSIAICTSCLLPWYLPQSRSRSDWRLGGDR